MSTDLISDAHQMPGASADNPAQPLPVDPNILATQPPPVNAFGATPSITPTYEQNVTPANAVAVPGAQVAPAYLAQAATLAPVDASAATVDPAQAQTYMQLYENAVRTALQPSFDQQARNLQDSSAARGISHSGAAGQLQTDLQGQQAAALAAADQPIISQGYGYTQADIAANQNNQQQVNLTNASAANAAASQTAANQQQVNLTNAGATNAAASQDAAQRQAAQLQAAQNDLQAQEFNAGNGQGVNSRNAAIANTTATQNANYYGDVLAADYGAYTQYVNALFNQGANQSNALLGARLNSYAPNPAVTGSINTGTTGAIGAYNNIYNQANSTNPLGTAAGIYGALATGGAAPVAGRLAGAL